MSSNTFNMEKMMFERQLYNKCSSYIDAKMHYDLVASDLILNNQTIIRTGNKNNMEVASKKKSTKSNIKKVRQVISSKIKRILHLNDIADASHFTPENNENNLRKKLSLSMTKSRKSSSKYLNESIKLVNFKYNATNINSLTKSSNENKKNLINLNPRLSAQKHRRCSDGQLSCGSSGSSEYDNQDRIEQPNFEEEEQEVDNNSQQDIFDSELFMSSQITHLFSHYQHQESTKSKWYDCTSHLVQTEPIASSSLMQTSTPLNRTSKMLPSKFANNTTSKLMQSNLMHDIDEFYLINSNLNNVYPEDEDQDETCNYNDVALMMDQSTQVPVDSPVLIESTFNTSSCSNLSDDLIILQTAVPKPQPNVYYTPKFSSTNIFSDKKSKTSCKKSSKKEKHINKKESTRFLNVSKTSKKTVCNLSSINKNVENSLFNGKLPQWAVGQELNLAIVNQLYYNPNGKGVFNVTNSFASKLL